MRIALTFNLRRSRSLSEREAEFDTQFTIDSLTNILVGLGHSVVPVEVTCSVRAIVGRLLRASPDLVFNLAEGMHGAFREAFYPALFEQLGLPHTGSSASALALCLDKALAKRVVASAGVATPKHVFIHSPSDLEVFLFEDADKFAYPIIVKPNFEGSSKGITQASVVDGKDCLAGVVLDLLDQYRTGVLIEELIDGADVSVAWVAGLGVLAPIGFAYEPTGRHHILDYALKHGPPEAVRVEIPARFDACVNTRIMETATRTFAALGIGGYGRADYRVTASGDVWFLEMNPLPTLSPNDEELYVAAKWMGKTPSDLIAAIVASSSPKTSMMRSERGRISIPGARSVVI